MVEEVDALDDLPITHIIIHLTKKKTYHSCSKHKDISQESYHCPNLIHIIVSF